MSRICAVSFQRYGRLYYFAPGTVEPRVGDKVLVPTDEGPEVAECVWAPQEIPEEFSSLPELVGLATQEALERDERNQAVRARARVVVKRMVREHRLPMKIVGVDYVDRTRTITAYFAAEGRVDFRDLVRDLVRELSARVLLRQLSARDEARIQGGIGPCGRDLCCSTFLTDFEPVTLRMAKDQDLPMNPLKISGACGRLLCCLKYEHPLYQQFAEQAPPLGAQVDTPAGDGTVVGFNVPSDTVVVRLSAGGRRCSCSRASVCAPRGAYDEAHPGG
ncbi:MAG: PSP1 domain-containing protein [Mycobacteriales bacterium]